MLKKVKPIPDGYRNVTPYIIVNGAPQAIEFYKKAFGAKDGECLMQCPESGKVMHAELRIGDSMIMLADACAEMGNPATKSSLMLYVENVDKTFAAALKAGAKQKRPIENQFWGDRFGQVTDPWGQDWGLATRVEDVSPAEMKRRGEKFMKQTAAA